MLMRGIWEGDRARCRRHAQWLAATGQVDAPIRALGLWSYRAWEGSVRKLILPSLYVGVDCLGCSATSAAHNCALAKTL